MATEFETSDCRNAALNLAASGSAIIAELLRLSNHIPDVFLFAKEGKGKKGKSATDTYIAANGKVLDPREVELRYSE